MILATAINLTLHLDNAKLNRRSFKYYFHYKINLVHLFLQYLFMYLLLMNLHLRLLLFFQLKRAFNKNYLFLFNFINKIIK